VRIPNYDMVLRVLEKTNLREIDELKIPNLFLEEPRLDRFRTLRFNLIELWNDSTNYYLPYDNDNELRDME
jgi:regulator of PEP synthase PpsR (kinase-PPPase family)